MKKLVLAVAMTLAAAGQAIAGPYTTPTSNNILGEVGGWLGANLYLVGGSSDIKIEFLGKEAGATNMFYFQDVLEKDTGAGGQVGPLFPAEDLGTVLGVAPGLLNFKFTTTVGVVPNSVSNGANVLPDANPANTKPNFFISLGSGPDFRGNAKGGPILGSGTVAILAFDDSGAGSDDNHDDLVIRLTLTNGTFSAPDGGTTLSLLGAALLGLGIVRRKLAI